eukprot:gene21893-27867_t
MWPGELSHESKLTNAISACSLYLNVRSLSSLALNEGQAVRYSCGAITQWIADVGASSSDAGIDFFSLWTPLVSADRKDVGYRPDDFIAQVRSQAPQAISALNSILNGNGTTHWLKIAGALSEMGVIVKVNDPTPFSLEVAAAKPLVLSACNEIDGVGMDSASALTVYAPESCAAFEGQATIESA